jgi:hypothetical protein
MAANTRVPHHAALGVPPGSNSMRSFAMARCFDLRDTALVDAEFGCDFPTLPVKVVQERDDAILSRRKTSSSLSNIKTGCKRRRGLCRKAM